MSPDEKSLYERIMLKSEHMVAFFDKKTKNFIFINPAFEKVWQRSAESIKSNPEIITNAIHADDYEYVKKSYERLQDDKSSHLKFRMLTPNEDVIWIMAELFLISNDAGENIVAAIMEDFTKEKANYNNVRKFAAKKDSVLEILSHDLAGPLHNIKNLSDILSDRLSGSEDAESKKILTLLDRTTTRSIKLIREFVKQEFLESSSVEIIKGRVDLVQKVREMMEQYEEAGKELNKNFILKSSAKKIFVQVDNYKFMQVLNNLISNSMKFTYDGGTIIVGIEDMKNHVLVTVEDNGIGIPGEYHDKLFDKFTPIRRVGLKGEPSVGLGMSIIKTIVGWHEGRIWFKSEVDKGTTFYIELPKE